MSKGGRNTVCGSLYVSYPSTYLMPKHQAIHYGLVCPQKVSENSKSTEGSSQGQLESRSRRRKDAQDFRQVLTLQGTMAASKPFCTMSHHTEQLGTLRSYPEKLIRP